MANFVSEDFKKLQKQYGDVLSDYQMDTRYGGSYVSDTFGKLCNINDKMIIDRAKHVDYETAIDKQLQNINSNDVRVELFLQQATLSIAKNVYAEDEQNISDLATSYTRWHIGGAVQNAGVKGLTAVTDMEDNFGQIVDCFQDERLPEEATSKFDGIVGAVQDTFDNLVPYVEKVEEAREKIDEMDSSIRMYEKNIKTLQGKMQDTLSDYAKSLYAEPQETDTQDFEQ